MQDNWRILRDCLVVQFTLYEWHKFAFTPMLNGFQHDLLLSQLHIDSATWFIID